jgi:hypothetical protein
LEGIERNALWNGWPEAYAGAAQSLLLGGLELSLNPFELAQVVGSGRDPAGELRALASRRGITATPQECAAALHILASEVARILAANSDDRAIISQHSANQRDVHLYPSQELPRERADESAIEAGTLRATGSTAVAVAAPMSAEQYHFLQTFFAYLGGTLVGGRGHLRVDLSVRCPNVRFAH